MINISFTVFNSTNSSNESSYFYN